ncbi:MAG: ATP-binding cassette domain-containing protein [Proteobacteria bacterium]|nr:ATP-binding cassette domain-containing protein [Pseudomonadota bacterium]
MSTVLHANNVSRYYGTTPALQNVTVTVGAGEFVVLLGPNGAGKTTLFHVLAGLYSPRSGDVQLAGIDLRQRAPDALARIGVVFQQSTIDLDMTLSQNLLFHARLHGMSRKYREARMDDALLRTGLESRRDEAVRMLSGGNRRRAELARAMLHEPELLLMDEPSAGLDPVNRKQLLDDVHALCDDSGTGVLWATHLVDEAEDADRVIVLHEGRVRADLPPSQLLRQFSAPNIHDAFIALTAGPGREHSFDESGAT